MISSFIWASVFLVCPFICVVFLYLFIFFFFLLYSVLQKSFLWFYLPAHGFILLLQIPSRVFLISVIVLFVSVCLFFNSSKSLLIDSCIFSILFSRFLVIFTIIILNSFSGNLPLPSSFIWTSVFLVCSFICIVFLCLFIIIICLNWSCLRSPFPRLQGWILSSF